MARCDFAKWIPGPSGKQGGYPSYPYGTAKLGVINHSAEGWRAGLAAVLTNPSAGSWHFTVYRDGSIEQHYDSDAVCWHCGVRPEWRKESNATLVGIEHEGVAGMALTEAQYQSSLKVNRWLFEIYKWGQPQLKVNLWEHGWLSATSCPSGRIPWDRLIKDLKGAMMDRDRASRQGSILLGRRWERPDIGWPPIKDDITEASYVIHSVEFQARLNAGWDVPSMPWKMVEEITRLTQLLQSKEAESARIAEFVKAVDLARAKVGNL